MKTIKNALVLGALIFGILTSFANEKLNKGKLVSISNASGKIIYSAQIDSEINIEKVFDFSQLKDGRYTIEINKDFEIEINSIEVKNRIVKALSDTYRKVFKPIFRTEDAKVFISKIAFDTDTIEVELYFEDELIHTEKVDDSEAVINKIYRLDETQKGSYKAIVKTNNRVFVERFKI